MKVKCIFIKALTPLCANRPCASDLTGLTGAAGTIVIGYRGTFAFGKDGLSDVKFRKLTRILVHGKVIFFFSIHSNRILDCVYIRIERKHSILGSAVY